MTRTQKSAWNFSGGFVFTFVTVGVGLVSTPLLLRLLGTEVFGSYRVMLDLGGYLFLLELGMSGALYARLALALGKNDVRLVEKLLASGIRFYLRVGVVVLLVGSILAVPLPYIFRTAATSAADLRIAWGLFLVATFLLPLSVYRLLVEAQQRSYLVSLLLTIQSLLTTALLLATAYSGWGLPGQTAAMVLAQIPINLVLFWLGSRRFKVSRALRSDDEVRQSLKRLNLPTFAYNSSYRVGNLSDTVFVGFILGPAAAAPFFLTQRLASLAASQLLNVGNSTWAGIAELYAQNRFDVLRARLLELTGFVSGLSLVALVPIAAFNRHFVGQWVGAVNFGGETLSVLVCVNAWMVAIFYLWGWTLSGTGNIAHWTRYAIAFIVVNVAISIVGTITFGLVGPALGTLAACLLVTAWALPRTLQKLFSFAPGSLWRQALNPLRWALPYALLLWFISHAHTPAGWPGLILEMGLAGLVGMALWWTLGLSGEDRSLWRGRLQEALGR